MKMVKKVRDVKKGKKLFWKILRYAVAMLLAMVSVVSLLIYLLIPPFYRALQRAHYEQLLLENEQLLISAESLTIEIQALLDILRGSNATFSIFDENQHLLFAHNPTDIYRDYFQIHPGVVNDGDKFSLQLVAPLQTREAQVANATIVDFSYQTQVGSRLAQISIPTQPLDDARNVILTIFPIVGGIALVFALLVSVVFSRWVVIPIKNIHKLTISMANFKTNSLIPITSNDEIGELSKGVNYLFEQLKASIGTLEKEIKCVRDNENQKIDFLQTVSHELKTPLAAANSLIEGLRYKIPPYSDHLDYYLEECQTYLAKAITLTKESLKLAELGRESAKIFKLHAVFEECTASYKVILLSKQLSLSSALPKSVTVETNLNLFEKVLSNLYANAIYHNNEIGIIRISYSCGFLTIFNTCTPLRTAEINKLFEPLTTTSSDAFSTGIGLYIVKQLLQQLKIPFQFVPDNDQTGMCFILDLNQLVKKAEQA